MKVIHTNALCEVVSFKEGSYRLYCDEISKVRAKEIKNHFVKSEIDTSYYVARSLSEGGFSYQLSADFKPEDLEHVISYFKFKED